MHTRENVWFWKETDGCKAFDCCFLWRSWWRLVSISRKFEFTDGVDVFEFAKVNWVQRPSTKEKLPVILDERPPMLVGDKAKLWYSTWILSLFVNQPSPPLFLYLVSLCTHKCYYISSHASALTPKCFLLISYGFWSVYLNLFAIVFCSANETDFFLFQNVQSVGAIC